MRAFPVGRWVNDPRHEGPKCLEPLTQWRPAPAGYKLFGTATGVWPPA
jgi:hypothetical protein